MNDMKISHAMALCAVFLLPACFSPYLLPAVYLEAAGIVTEGRVTQKRESIEMRGYDRWRHALEVTYRYTPGDTGVAETGTHQVDPSLFDRLQVGSPVKVRYTPWRLPRSLHIVAMGSALAESTWRSRLPGESDSARVAFDLGCAVIAGLVCVVAWRRKTRGWILAAALGAVTVFSAVLTCGFVAFPLLFAAWRKWPGQGYGWVLLGSVPLSVAVLYARIPQPTPLPSGLSREGIAIVRQVRSVDHIWSGWEDSGQQVPQPFQMADLEFTPERGHAPVHAVDRVDLNSLPDLREGAKVGVVYSLSNPRFARIDGGTRSYAERALVYLLKITFGIGAMIMLVVIPAMALADRALHRFWDRISRVPADQLAQNISRMPAGDPRRKALEKYLGRLQPGEHKPG